MSFKQSCYIGQGVYLLSAREYIIRAGVQGYICINGYTTAHAFWPCANYVNQRQSFWVPQTECQEVERILSWNACKVRLQKSRGLAR